ncbi:hypothetical protein D9M68_801350 [compost metagenome]
MPGFQHGTDSPLSLWERGASPCIVGTICHETLGLAALAANRQEPPYFAPISPLSQRASLLSSAPAMVLRLLSGRVSGSGSTPALTKSWA